ncbi:hypothetical protein CU098_007291, partial [Rhizopus stolonifer]
MSYSEMSFNELLIAVSISSTDEYIKCIRSTLKMNKIFIKRSPNATFLNNYNRKITKLENNIVTITRAAIDDDTIGEPWIVNEKDVASLFKRYQHAIHDMVEQHTTLPLESYIYELAALTNVLVVCKNQHNVIAEKIFTLNLLKYLNDKPASDLIRNFELGQEDDLAINTYIIQLIHLRWTNTIPSEKGKPRPNAVICEKPQTNFKCSVGFGEAKVYQGSG